MQAKMTFDSFLRNRLHLVNEIMMHGRGNGRPPVLTKSHYEVALDMLRLLATDTKDLMLTTTLKPDKDMAHALVRCNELLGKVRKRLIDEKIKVSRESGEESDQPDIS